MKSTYVKSLLLLGAMSATFSTGLNAQNERSGNPANHLATATVTCGTDTIRYPQIKASGSSTINMRKGDVEGIALWYPRPAAATLHGLSFIAKVKDGARTGKTATLNVRVYNSGNDSLPQGIATSFASVSIDTNMKEWRVPLLAPMTLNGNYIVSLEYGGGLTDNDTIIFETNAAGDAAGESMGAGIYNTGTGTVWLDFEHLVPNPDREPKIYPWVSYSLTTNFSIPGDSVCLDESLPFVNTTIAFAGSKIYNRRIQDPGTYGFAYSWNFGDGSTSDAANPNKQYTATGAYSILLTSSIRGYHTTCSEPLAKPIVVEARPVAMFNSSAINVAAGDTVMFTNMSNGGSSCTWDFGDSTAIVMNCADQSHVYDSAGTYTVTLTIASPYGCEEIHTQTVTVSGTTAINNLTNSLDFQAYPNPMRDHLNINWSENAAETGIELFNLQGMKVMETSVFNTQEAQLSVQDLAAGMYILRVNQNEKAAHLRVMHTK